jgi:RNA:NAD 2'-phosphotransferase (TPT1/KptA family)
MRRGNRRDRQQGPTTNAANSNPLNQLSPNDGIMTPKKVKNLSKKLSYVLRHGAVKEGFMIDTAGFISVNELLAAQKFKNHSLEQIKYVVENNDKKRFEM